VYRHVAARCGCGSVSIQEPHGPEPRRPSPRPFIALAVGSAVVAVVSFVLMNLLFSVRGWLSTIGLLMFAVFLVSLLLILVGIVGAIWRKIR
jgi:hypothetical protein